MLLHQEAASPTATWATSLAQTMTFGRQPAGTALALFFRLLRSPDLRSTETSAPLGSMSHETVRPFVAHHASFKFPLSQVCSNRELSNLGISRMNRNLGLGSAAEAFRRMLRMQI